MREWNSEFPFLKRFGNSGLFFQTDIMLIGLYFDRISGEMYRPFIKGIPLWHTYYDWRKSFSFNNHVLRTRSADVECYYIFHDRFFQNNVGFTRQQYGNILKGKVTYADLYALESKYNDPIEGRRKFALRKSHLEYQLVLARYFGNDTNAEKILNLVEKVYQKDSNDKKTIEYHKSINFSLDECREKMYNYYGNIEAFMKVCSSHIEDKMVKKLNYATLINEPLIIKTPFQELVSFNWLKRFFDRYFGY